MKTIFGSGLFIVGGVLLIISALAGILGLSSFIQRKTHGAGLLFADVEIFVLVAFTTLIFGVVMIVMGRKIKRRAQH